MYAHGEIDHLRLFAALAVSGVEFLATYNYSERVIGWARRHDFSLARVIMKGGASFSDTRIADNPSPGVAARAPIRQRYFIRLPERRGGPIVGHDMGVTWIRR